MTLSASSCHKYELEIEIQAPRDRVWKAIFEETNLWWLPDFHVVGPDSVVTFDPAVGGRGLVEETPDGGGLLWYSVQMCMPSDFKVYLIGHLAPEWGGPATSSLKLALIESESGCIFQVTDARHGNVDEKQVQSSLDGWLQLFTDGLKSFVEK
ncbi:MAG: hypothetical protein AB8B55_09190 [Mariniblastus sp.]